MDFFPLKTLFIPDIDNNVLLQNFELSLDVFTISKQQKALFKSHSHENIELNFVEKGAVTYFHCNRIQRIEAGTLAAFWAGYPHRIIATEKDVKLWWLTIPLKSFLGWRFSEGFKAKLMAGDIVCSENSSSKSDRSLFDSWRSIWSDPKYKKIILLELEARIRRLELDSITSKPSHFDPNTTLKKKGSIHPLVIKIANYIINEFTQPLTLEMICKQVNLNPSYGARLFKKNLGCTIGKFLQDIRISHAINLLQTTQKKKIDIAYESGFQSLSRFYAVFRDVTGKKPKEFSKGIPFRSKNTP